MSDHVAWGPCPRCGLQAAVGWLSVAGTDGAPGQLQPVEFDCPSGCRVCLDELALAYGAADTPFPGPTEPPER